MKTPRMPTKRSGPGVLDSIMAVKSPVPLNEQIARTLDMIANAAQPSPGMEKLKQALLPVLQAETEVHAERLIQKLAEHIKKKKKGELQAVLPLKPQVQSEGGKPPQKADAGGAYGQEAKPLEDLIQMMPGAGKMKGLKNVKVDEKQLSHIEAIIKSMPK